MTDSVSEGEPAFSSEEVSEVDLSLRKELQEVQVIYLKRQVVLLRLQLKKLTEELESLRENYEAIA
jgi:hypothetical protein